MYVSPIALHATLLTSIYHNHVCTCRCWGGGSITCVHVRDVGVGAASLVYMYVMWGWG